MDDFAFGGWVVLDNLSEFEERKKGMTAKELKVLKHALSQAECYLEFGAGNSTKLAVSCPNIAKIVSVESDMQFFHDNFATDPAVQEALRTSRLKIHCVDIGETVKWGRPKDEQMRHLWPNYSLLPYNDFKDYDLVLVDGRFRMACALNAILNASKDFTLLIHDYKLRRQLHRLVWSGLLTVVNVVDSMGVFRPNPVNKRREVQRALKRYQYLPDDLLAFEKIRVLRVANRVRHYVSGRL